MTTISRQRRELGSLREHKGGWRIQVSGGKDDSGRRIRVSEVFYGSKTAAADRLRVIKNELESGKRVARDEETLAGFIRRWWPTKQQRLSPTTALNYDRLFERYILKQLGHMRTQGIKPIHVSAFLSSLIDKEKVGQAEHAYVLLRVVFNAAVKMEVIGRSPMAGVEKPRPVHKEITILTPDQVRLALEYLAVRKSWAFVPITLLIMTGLRRSELLGLRWSDVDLDTGVIRVMRSYHVLPGGGTRGKPKPGQGVLKEPKSRHGRRGVALDRDTVTLLKNYREQKERDLKMLRSTVKPNDYVFARMDGSPIPPQTISQHWRDMAERLGLPTSVHALRHTSASMLLSKGLNPRLVSERLGHYSTAFTMDVYGHVMPNQQTEAAELLAQTLGVGQLTGYRAATAKNALSAAAAG